MREERRRQEREIAEREREQDFGDSYEQKKRGWSGMFLGGEKEEGE